MKYIGPSALKKNKHISPLAFSGYTNSAQFRNLLKLLRSYEFDLDLPLLLGEFLQGSPISGVLHYSPKQQQRQQQQNSTKRSDATPKERHAFRPQANPRNGLQKNVRSSSEQ
jgi:hypothetical protein